ncbi:hypothetical protein ELAC_1983 [Estrella lausannensis]|uniref:Uncharacterized protein n=1 Tax=Estrella lausannensis TaxID=483423 RepID=A0A0H5E7K5_9BACT|nr:hypothetical protein ELAC_1983 [Estrella lausannensis]
MSYVLFKQRIVHELADLHNANKKSALKGLKLLSLRASLYTDKTPRTISRVYNAAFLLEYLETCLILS